MPDPGPRARVILGWIGAAVVFVVVAFVVGRPAGDANQPGALASASSSTAAAPLTIAFGTARDATTLLTTEPTSTFRRGDPFAYSVKLDEPIVSGVIYVKVDRVGETPATVQDWAEGEQNVDPQLAVISFEVPADNLVNEFGAGDYQMRISLQPAGEIIATGSFRLVEEPSAS
jgi:hypothetical protein